MIDRTARYWIRLLCCLVALAGTVRASALPLQQPQAGTEDKWLAVLRSDAPAADKAMACKQLAIVGSEAAVPELARLLPDPQLNSWALIPLEAIPGSAADEALRTAAGALSGRELVGVLHSIGVRKDVGSVNLLLSRLADADEEVAGAAAVALGQIGGPDAANGLQKALAGSTGRVRSTIAEACVLCAERMAGAGSAAAAIELYDFIRQADVPRQRVIEATRGAILARGPEGLPLLLETLRSPDRSLFQLGLQTMREFPAGAGEAALISSYEQADPQRGALILQALADRGGARVLEALRTAASGGDPAVRASAIESLGRIGDQSCLADLLAIAGSGPEELGSLAMDSIANLPVGEVDQAVLQLLRQADDKRLAILMRVIGRRRIDAGEEISRAVAHADPLVRSAALYAAGETVALDRLPWLVELVLREAAGADPAAGFQALRAACVRMPDPDGCARELARAVGQAPPDAVPQLLEILALVGGSEAMRAMDVAARSPLPQAQDVATRLLGTWNSVDVAPLLIGLAQTHPVEKYRVRAIRGYIGLIRKFDMPAEQRVAMCRTAWENAKRLADQELLVEVMKQYPSDGMIELAEQVDKVSGLEGTARELRKRLSEQDR